MVAEDDEGSESSVALLPVLISTGKNGLFTMGSKDKKSKKSIVEEPKNEADPSNRAQNGGNRRGGGKVVITDSRFASVHSDPRFAKLSKHKSKVAIDSRFDRMFTDKRFSLSSARVDKRGKARKDAASQNALKHYYRLEEEGERSKRKVMRRAADEGTEIDEESEESEEELKKPGVQSSNSETETESDASGSVEEGDKDTGEESDGDSSTDTTDTDYEDVIYSEEDNFVQEEDVPEIDKETCRLAVVNLDWRYVKAVDLYVLLSSFLPKVGQILSVAVYPSEFGLKRMEEEALHGPVGLFDDDKEKNETDDDDDDEIDNEKLRAYELSRLRYYYAVVECDSIATADYLYKTCDGVEFERSSNKLDLRFIPDYMEFKHPPRDVAREAPANYEGLDFHTKALQNSKINLSWDEDEPQRAKTLKRKFDDDQLAELELREFLASDDGVSDEDGNDDSMEDQLERKHKKEDLYRALLQSGEGSDEDGKEDQDQDMEITFNTGLEDLSKRLLEKKDKKSETVWEAYLRKRREKKKARKHRSKDSSEDESDDSDQEPKQDLDDFFEEPSVQGSKDGKGKSVRKGKKQQETSKEAEASRAELELLLADDQEADTALKGYNLKPKKAKGKRSKEIINEAKIPTADFDDTRFSALFTSPMYALDPTDPQFKRSVAYARQLAQKQRKGDQELSGKKQEKIFPREQAQLHSDDPETDRNELRPDKSSLKKEKHELSSMVKSVKMKSKQVKVPSSSDIPVNREKWRILARK